MSTFIYNTFDPGCPVAANPQFIVANDPIMITVAGLTAGQTLPIEVELTGTCGTHCAVPYAHWVPVSRGCPMELSATANQYIEFMPGKYRVNTAALTPGQQVLIAKQDDAAMRDMRPSFCYPVGCAATSPSATPVCPPATAVGNVTTWG